MSDISVTSKQVAPVWPHLMESYSIIAGEALDAGVAVYLNGTTGKAYKADANGASGEYRFLGITLQKVGAGQAVSVLLSGAVAGFDVSGMNYDAPVYLSDTAGALATASGTNECVVGRVMPLADASRAKVLYIQSRYLNEAKEFATNAEAMAMAATGVSLTPANLAALFAASPDLAFATDKGPVLKAPDGSAKRLVVANDGTVSSESAA